MKEMKNMAYWKRRNGLPGINHESDKNLPDGRSTSSPFQDNVKASGEKTVEDKATDLEPTKTKYAKELKFKNLIISKKPVNPVKPKSTAEEK